MNERYYFYGIGFLIGLMYGQYINNLGFWQGMFVGIGIMVVIYYICEGMRKLYYWKPKQRTIKDYEKPLSLNRD